MSYSLHETGHVESRIDARAAGDAQAAGFCLACWATFTMLVLVIWASFAYLKIDFGGLVTAESRGYMWKFFISFFPPNVSAEFLAKTLKGTLETLAISAIGTLLAALFGVLLALPASGRYGAALQQITRFVLNLLRSVPELVWAAVMVLAAGLGPFAGTLALALHTTGVLAIAITYGGMLGKVYAEILESSDTRNARALLEAGSGRLATLCYGLLPGAAQELASYTVYRWECAVRASVVMGFVGAGGLGQLMDTSMKMLNGGEAATILIVFLLLVLLADAISAFFRRVLA